MWFIPSVMRKRVGRLQGRPNPITTKKAFNNRFKGLNTIFRGLQKRLVIMSRGHMIQEKLCLRFQPRTRFTEEEKEEESRSLGGVHRDEALLIWGNTVALENSVRHLFNTAFLLDPTSRPSGGVQLPDTEKRLQAVKRLLAVLPPPPN